MRIYDRLLTDIVRVTIFCIIIAVDLNI